MVCSSVNSPENSRYVRNGLRLSRIFYSSHEVPQAIGDESQVNQYVCPEKIYGILFATTSWWVRLTSTSESPASTLFHWEQLDASHQYQLVYKIRSYTTQPFRTNISEIPKLREIIRTLRRIGLKCSWAVLYGSTTTIQDPPQLFNITLIMLQLTT